MWWSIFVGCIAKLMKSSGLEVYVAAAYAGLTGNITIITFTGWKSLVKAIRAFHAHLQVMKAADESNDITNFGCSV